MKIYTLLSTTRLKKIEFKKKVHWEKTYPNTVIFKKKR